MYRAAATRLIGGGGSWRLTSGVLWSQISRSPAIVNDARCCSGSGNDSSSPPSSPNLNRIPNRVWKADLKSEHRNSQVHVESPTLSSSSSSSSFDPRKADDVGIFEISNRESGRGGRSFHGSAQYQVEQARVLEASLRHVKRLGWTLSAMFQGARDVGLSQSIVGSFPRKEAALVEYFMDKCLEKLMDINDSKEEDLRNFSQSERILKVVKTRLEMQALYIAKWPQVLSIQALPSNMPASFKQRAMLVDEFWQAAGDTSTDLDWYVKRTILGGIYSATEIYMLTDLSPEFRDTWRFLDNRVRDAFHLKNTLLEGMYFFETIGAGMNIQLRRHTV
ncbi:unnamed protein product [Rhodiola kirilowii]